MSQIVDVIPTSDLDVFKKMMTTPNVEYSVSSLKQKNNHIKSLKKNLVLAFVSDSGGCAHIRTIFPLSYLNSLYGKSGNFNLVTSPVIITQSDILTSARSILLQRRMSPSDIPVVRRLKEQQQKYKYKIVYDVDDFIFNDDKVDGVPDYNFGKTTISQAVIDSHVAIMQMCDTVCVSTEYLGKYISNRCSIPMERIAVVPNTVAQYFWGSKRKAPIKKRIEKPKVIWTASPTHWNDDLKLYGDMDNAWREWVIKNVNEGKIDYIQMGGCPWFFEEIRDKIKVIKWVNSYQYHMVVMQNRPDFGIGPLVKNNFNMSKSDIKAIEQYAVGSAFIGTSFDYSPYNDCFLKLGTDATVDDIDALFWAHCEPDAYNSVVTKQYEYMHSEGRYTESPRNVNLLTSLL